jgi:two-component system chemotaxis response regulator CheB
MVLGGGSAAATPRPIRVLVVDDSATCRRCVLAALAGDPAFEPLPPAADGEAALEAVARHAPDVVVLDGEMPKLDGFGVLRALRARGGDPPAVVMFSVLGERGGRLALEALALGAAEFVPKPTTTSLTSAVAAVRAELAPLVKALGEGRLRRPAPDAAPSPSRAAPGPTRAAAAGASAPVARRSPPRALAIASSTGGPHALEVVLGALPADFPLPIAVVQHMPAGFTRLLAERLRAKCPLDVREAAEGDELRPGLVLLAPGDFHLRLRAAGDRVVAALDRGPQENSVRPAADVLFRTAAEVYGGGLRCLVLTGMGSDGALGVAAARERGAFVFAQDEASSVVWGMPGAVVRAGAADVVLPLGELGGEIVRRVAAVEADPRGRNRSRHDD